MSDPGLSAALEASLSAAVKAIQAGKLPDAVDPLEFVLERSRRLALPEPEMLATGLMAHVLAGTGQFEEARREAQRAVEIADALGEPDAEKHYRELLEQIERSLDASRPLSDQEIGLAMQRAEELLSAGAGLDAEAVLAPLAQAAREASRDDVEASACGMLAQARVMQGRPDKALEPASRALELAEQADDEQAAGHFRRLVQAIEDGGAAAMVESGRTRAQVQAASEQARRALEAGRPEEAQQLLEPWLETVADDPIAEAGLRGLLAQVLLAMGQRAEAEPHARRALEIAVADGGQEAVDAFTELLAMVTGWTSPVETD